MAEARTSGPGARTSGTANGHGPRQDAAPADGSFDVRLQMLPGITPREEQDFEQGLTRYLQERSLLGEGTPLAMTIRSVEQELTTTDQVDLIAWVMRASPVAVVWIKDSTGDDVPEGAGIRAGRLRASRSDMAVPLALQLYQLGRIGPAVVAHVLTP